MSALRLLRWSFRLAVVVGFLGFAGASSFGSTSRIAAVDPNELTALPGGVSPKLSAANDLGAMPAGQRLEQMSLRFTMTAEQQASLAQYLVDVQNPASPRYHRWLTPEQFGAQFGMAADDLAKVTTWLTAQGFTVTSVARGGLFVQFSGTVAQASQAFHTQIHSVSLEGVQHFANVSAPTLPKAIAAVTAAVTGLNDFKRKPHHVERIIPASDVVVGGTVAHPSYTSSTNGSHYIAPGDFYKIYDENSLISGGTNGSGVTVAIVGQVDIYPADIAAFRSNSGLAANPPTVVLYGTDPGYPNSSGTPSNLDLLESELDLEWIGATAPAASVLFITSLDVIDGSLTQAVDNNLAPIISDSYGDCEPDLGAGDLVYYNTLLEQAAAEGITITAAAGDTGATDCEAENSVSAKTGLAVDFPADSPWVTGVGGTEFSEGSGTYWSSTNGANSGSALSYIPEVVWNDYSVGGGIAAGGGGASAYFSKPSWQTGTGVPNDYSRDVPDVSLNASADHDGYLICTAGYCTNGYRSASGSLAVVGGTSVSAPSFAGLLALVEQKTGTRIGVANNILYALAASTYASSVFHDITTGNNASPCTTGTTNCPNGGTIGYTATVGYDQATGWGSMDAANLVNDWAKVTPLTTTGGLNSSYVSLAGSASSVVQGISVTMTATVTAASATNPGTPTGVVAFAVDGKVLSSTSALTSGVATYTLSTTALTVGAHTVQATYTGDSNYMGSKAVFTITVTASTLPDFTISPTTSTVTTKSGTIAPGLQFTIASLNGFSGSVNLVASYSTTLQANSSFTVDPVTASSSTPGVTTLTLFAYVYTADNTHAPMDRNAVQLAQRRRYEASSGIALASLLAIFLLPRRRRIGGLLAAVLAVATLSLSGCLSSTSTSVTGPQINTPAGTYPITVSATATINGVAVTRNSTITFVVQ